MRALVLFAPVLLLSTSVIMIKGGTAHPFLLATWRMWMAVLLVLPFYLLARRRHPDFPPREAWRRALLPGVLLGAHFMSWNWGVRLTSPANSGLTLNTMPLVTPLVMWLYARDRITWREWTGTAFAFSGVAVIAWSDFHFNAEHFRGDLICVGSIWICALYVAAGRRNRDFPSVWLYVLPLYTAAASLCLAVALVFTDFWQVYPLREYGMALGLAVVCTLLGHSLLNYSLRLFRGQTVSLVSQLQSLFNALWGWLIFDSLPRPAFYLAAVLMITGVLFVVLPRRRVSNAEAGTRNAERKSE